MEMTQHKDNWCPWKENFKSRTGKRAQRIQNRTRSWEEWNGRTIYIPDEILDELEDTYLESQLKLRKAGQDEFKKSRHFYPLLVQFGIDALSDADYDEIQDRLTEISDEWSPLRRQNIQYLPQVLYWKWMTAQGLGLIKGGR